MFLWFCNYFGKEKPLSEAEKQKGNKPEVDFENIGMYDWPIYQTAAAFPRAFPHIFPNYETSPTHCLVAYAIDQDPYFRLARDIAMQAAATDGSIFEDGNDKFLEQDYIKDPSKTVGDLIQDGTQKFGERTEIGRISKFVI